MKLCECFSAADQRLFSKGGAGLNPLKRGAFKLWQFASEIHSAIIPHTPWHADLLEINPSTTDSRLDPELKQKPSSHLSSPKI